MNQPDIKLLKPGNPPYESPKPTEPALGTDENPFDASTTLPKRGKSSTFFEYDVARLALSIVTGLIMKNAIAPAKGLTAMEFLEWAIDDTVAIIEETTPKLSRDHFE